MCNTGDKGVVMLPLDRLARRKGESAHCTSMKRSKESDVEFASRMVAGQLESRFHGLRARIPEIYFFGFASRS